MKYVYVVNFIIRFLSVMSLCIVYNSDKLNIITIDNMVYMHIFEFS